MWNKKFGRAAIVGIVALAIIVLMLLMVPGSSAENNNFPPYLGIRDTFDQNGNVIEKDPYCHLLDGNGNEVTIPREQAKINESNNSDGNVLLQCDLIVDPSDEGGSVRWLAENTNLLACEYFGDQTTANWQVVVSASGNARLTCHIENPQ